MKVGKNFKVKKKHEKESLLLAVRKAGDCVDIADFSTSAEDLMTVYAIVTSFFMDALAKKYEFGHSKVYKALELATTLGAKEFEESYWQKEEEDDD